MVVLFNCKLMKTEIYIRKLGALQDWIFRSIDRLQYDKQELVLAHESIDVEFQMTEINKPKVSEDSSIILITEHAYDRAKERLSMNRTAFMKLAERAYMKGVKHCDSAGNLKKWIDKTWFSHRNADNIRIYGEVFFLFSRDKLITVYQVPNNLRKSALKIQKHE